jgi:hypothetical protein
VPFIEPRGSLPCSKQPTTGPYRKPDESSPHPTTYQTNSMEQGPSWETNSFSASQQVPLLLWNPNVHYRVHKSLSLVHILSQMDPVLTFPPNIPKVHSNVIFISTCKFSEWPFSFKSYSTNFFCILLVLHAPLLILLDLITLVTIHVCRRRIHVKQNDIRRKYFIS